MKTKIFTLLLIYLLNTPLFARPAQITFIYPMGSNGIDSITQSNELSLNILAGLNGGLNGVEVGSILNYNNGPVKGVQVSGVANITKGTTDGVAIAGVLNLSTEASSGIQVSTINMGVDTFEGVSVGVINLIGTLKGVSLGVINVVDDSSEGLPIGLFSFVRNGFFALELETTNTLLSTLNYKMGVKRFYTIIKVGYSPLGSSTLNVAGLGWGTQIALSDSSKIVLDVTSNSISDSTNSIFTADDSTYNSINKVDINYKLHLLKNLSVFAGPSLDILVSEQKTDGSYISVDNFSPFYTKELSNSKLSVTFGLSVGISLEL